jgi:hypothetical protein
MSEEGGDPITYNRNIDVMLAKHRQVKASAMEWADYRCLGECSE